MIEIKNNLNKARKLKLSNKYREALAIYDECYKTNSEDFKYRDKEDYAWIIYNIHVSKPKSEEDLFKSVEFITHLVQQKDLKDKDLPCVYTSAVFSILKYLKDNEDFYRMLYWLDKVNPEFLNKEPYKKYGKLNKSKKEFYYDLASNAYFKCMDYESCIDISKGLNTIDKIVDDSWIRLRIGRSLKELNRFSEAIEFLKDALEIRKEWYIYKDIAECYCMLRKPLEVLEYSCPVVLSNVPNNIKINIYYIIYNALKGFNKEQALNHAKFYYILKMEKGYSVPYEIRKLNFDINDLDKKQLENEIQDIWMQYKFKNQQLQYGTVTRFFEDKNYGFIKTNDDESLFFHKNEFRGNFIYVGQLVSFYTEMRLDKSKNRESMNAVNIRGG